MAKPTREHGNPKLAAIEMRAALARGIATHAPSPGVHPTAITGLDLFRRPAPSACYLASYEPSLTIFVQGRKLINLGGTEYGRSDLVRLDAAGAFSLYWGAAAAGVPPYANLVGAAIDGAGTLVLTFDVPTRLGGTEFLPGQLVRFTGGSFSSYFADPAWPRSAQLRDFAFAPGAGAVPDGGAVAGEPLRVGHAAAGAISLSWGAGCGTGSADYAVYEGSLGSYYSHAPRLCTTGGATSVTFVPPAGNTYYVVVPRNALREGSYGKRTGGAEVPPAPAACLPQEILACP